MLKVMHEVAASIGPRVQAADTRRVKLLDRATVLLFQLLTLDSLLFGLAVAYGLLIGLQLEGSALFSDV